MKRSAGILLYRGDEVLLVHPGGPFWAKKDAGAWSIPKGEYEDGDDPRACALREFEEELGTPLLVPAALPAADSEGRLLVANQGDGTLMVFDIPSNALVATIPVGKEPHEVVAAPNGRKAWVACSGAAGVAVVDLGRNVVVKTIKHEQLKSPHGLAITPDGRRLMATSEGNRRVFLIDAARDVVERAVTSAHAGPHLIALTREGKQAWVANRTAGNLSVIDLPALKMSRTIKTGQAPEGLATSPNGRWVVAALADAGQVAVIDTAHMVVATRLPAGLDPVQVIFKPQSAVALVANRLSGDVTVLDVAARQVIATVPVERRPSGLAVNLRGSRAYVANSGSASVSILSMPGWEVTGRIPTGSHPDGIAFAPPPAAPAKKRGASAPKGKP